MSAQRILASGAAALLVLIVLAIVFLDDEWLPSGAAKTTTLPTTPAGTLRAHVAAGGVTLDGPVADAERVAPPSSPRRAIASARRTSSAGSQVRWPCADSAEWPQAQCRPCRVKARGFGAIDVIAPTKTTRRCAAACPRRRPGRICWRRSRRPSGRQVSGRARDRRGQGATGLLQKNIDDALKGRTIAFNTGSAGITKGGLNVLAALVKPLKAAGSARVVVGGYTDSVGDAKANLKLSRARAHSVWVVWLTKQGVKARTLIARGYGEARPIAPNNTEAGRQKNRRIEFTVLGG